MNARRRRSDRCVDIRRLKPKRLSRFARAFQAGLDLIDPSQQSGIVGQLITVRGDLVQIPLRSAPIDALRSGHVLGDGAVRLTACGRSSSNLGRSRRSPRPCCIRLSAKVAKGRAADQVTLNVEGVVDRGVGGEESLGGGLGFEALLLPFSSSDRQMEVFDPIVLPQPTRAVNLGQAKFSKRGAVRRQAVGRDHLRLDGLAAQQAA